MLAFRSLVRRPALALSFRSACLAWLLLLGLSAAGQSAAQRPAAGRAPQTISLASNRPGSRLSLRVQKLLGEMTLEEKIGQMTQLDISTINTTGRQKDVWLDSAKAASLIRTYHIGSFLNGEAVPPLQWVRFSAALQRIALRESRLHIPIIYGIDHMHGASYVTGAAIFPHNLALAATFEPEFARQEARATVLESADLGHHWVFAPVLDLGVNAYWPRFYETYGEDPLVAATLGAAYVRELQGNPDIAPYKVAGCGKHFLGYSDPRSGWDRTSAEISDQRLQEFFRPSFQAAINAGLKSVMVNSGLLNGQPVHASKAVLTTLLREQMGFQGVAVTDWEDIKRLVRVQHVAANEKEATWMALDAGIDMAMTPYTTDFCRYVKELVAEGRLSPARIDLSAGRILQLKDELGLFEHPLPRTDRLARIGDPVLRAQALAAARESIVLLKNEQNTLPLNPVSVKRLLVVGPSADSRANLSGGWTLAWQGRREAAYPAATVETVAYRDTLGQLFLPQVQAAARQADAVVLALGEKPYAEGLGNTNDLSLPDDQLQLVRAVQAAERPLVLVVVGGRPTIVRPVAAQMGAILWAGLPGFEGGQALAEVISGRVNPSGKLPFTYPQYAGHLSPYHHDNNENSLELSDFGADFEKLNRPAGAVAMHTQFGEGLSYTTYRYDNLRLSDSLLTGPTARLQATVRLTNTGPRAGREAALWFITDEVGRRTRPVRQLRHFEKVALEPGQSRELSFDIDPRQHLGYPNETNQLQLEDGFFTLRIGTQQARFRYQGRPAGTTTPTTSLR